MADQDWQDNTAEVESEQVEAGRAVEDWDDLNEEEQTISPEAEEADLEAAVTQRSTGSVAQSDSMDAETINVANQQWIKNYLADDGPSVRELSYREFATYSGDKLGMFQDITSVEGAVLDEMVERLKDLRIALIVGASELGKGSCALTAGARLSQSGQRIQEVLVAEALTRDVRVRLKLLLEKKKYFGNRVVVLEDAFDRSNIDLVRFVERLDKAQLATLTEQLRQAGSYLILTSVPERVPTQASQLTSLRLLTQLEPPPPTLLLTALHRKAFALAATEPDRQGTLRKLLDENGEEIVLQLGSVPRVLRFVDSYLMQVLDGELSVDEALDRVDNLEHWLLIELPNQDRETWSFVLALLLASSEPTSDWVPWLPFYRVWQEVAKELDAALGGEPEEPRRSAADLLVDPQFLSRARALVRRMPFPIGECVRFQERDYASKLWKALLGSGRRIFSLLVGRLCTLAEGGDPAVRRIAAQALGRAGELDPRSLFFPQVARWSRSKEDRHHSSLGALFCGVLASDDNHYRAGCFHRLRRATHSRSLVEVRAGILSLSQVGVFDLTFVMKELRRIAEHRLGQLVEEVESLNRALRALRAEFEKSESAKSDRRQIEQQHRYLLEKLAPRLFSNLQVVVLGTIQYTLVGLSFGRDPLKVLEHLTHWMRADKPGFPPLVALLALRDYGILDVLERHPVIVDPTDSEGDEDSPPRACSRILTALRSEEEVLDLRDFLQALYRSTAPFPAWFRKQLQDRLRDLFRKWGDEATAKRHLEEATVQLFAAMLDSTEPEVSEFVFELLKRDPAFRDDDMELSPIVAAALEAMPPRRTGSAQRGSSS